MNGIPDGLGFESLQAEMPEVGIARIELLAVGKLGPSLRGHFVGLRRHHQPVHLLHAVVPAHELRREPVEQGRMRGRASEPAEVTRKFLQTFTEMPLPQSIDGDAREQRILRGGQPVRKRLDPAFPEIVLAFGKWPAWLHLMLLFRPGRIAAGQDVTFFLLTHSIHFHRVKDRDGWSAAPARTDAGRVELGLQLAILLPHLLGQDLVNLV